MSLYGVCEFDSGVCLLECRQHGVQVGVGVLPHDEYVVDEALPEARFDRFVFDEAILESRHEQVGERGRDSRAHGDAEALSVDLAVEGEHVVGMSASMWCRKTSAMRARAGSSP